MDNPLVNIVLFHREREVPIAQVAQTLRSLARVEVEITSRTGVTVREGGWPVAVVRAAGPHVAEESREIADHCATGRADRTFIATYDRRFEVSWVPDQHLEHVNLPLVVTQQVAALVDGITLDAAGQLDDPRVEHTL